MNKIIVRAVSVPTADQLALITGAARMTQVRGLMPDGVELDKKLLGRLLAMGHTSVLEMADFAVVVENATRVFLGQITRHRLASYTSASQQYQLHDGFGYLMLPFETLDQDDPEAAALAALYEQHMKDADELYQRIELHMGRDWARYVLPGACRNTLLIKATLREWFTIMFPQRLCRRNTPETLHVMRKALTIAHRTDGLASLVEATGPACRTRGCCDQGRMSCGRPYKCWQDMLGMDTVDLGTRKEGA